MKKIGEWAKRWRIIQALLYGWDVIYDALIQAGILKKPR